MTVPSVRDWIAESALETSAIVPTITVGCHLMFGVLSFTALQLLRLVT
jgi:hypothetical protein